jgi:anti-sigma B factor antagonist
MTAAEIQMKGIQKVGTMSLSISGSYDNDLSQWLFSVAGEVDISNAQEMKTKLEASYREHEADLMIDVSDLNYIDSTGLGVIIGIYGQIRGADHRIVLINPRENVKKLLRITSLDKVLC